MLRVYNTLTGSKEVFTPLHGNTVHMYACGITVSGEAHIGHAYQALIYDIIRRYLVKKGYDVTYARNYTDVDDKIIASAAKAGVDAREYARNMIGIIDREMRRLEVGDPDIWLRATDHIQHIVQFVQDLIATDHAYATPKGDVYFAVSSYGGYGHLSNRNLQDAMVGVRIDPDEQKRDALDFALWKSAKPGEIFWHSPWGAGRPGWHIECSCMNRVAFGDQIDIHGGGRDLIFPHHENEIAQTEALTGKPFAKYWFHNGLIKVNGQKMSKSLGNSLLLRDLLDAYAPQAIKFALLQNNYRQDINITDNLFPDAARQMADFCRVLVSVQQAYPTVTEVDPAVDAAFDEAMDDDFNTAKALSDLYAWFKQMRQQLAAGDSHCAALANGVRATYALLGLFADPAAYVADYDARHTVAIPAEVQDIAARRFAAKQARDWATADALRAQLTAMGWTVKDSKEGYTLSKIE